MVANKRAPHVPVLIRFSVPVAAAMSRAVLTARRSERGAEIVYESRTAYIERLVREDLERRGLLRPLPPGE